MSFINWTKKLSVHILEIDEQHQSFIGMINDTHSAIDKMKENKIKESVNELVGFARTHFSTEEEYFDKWKYPYKQEHEKEHEKLLLRVLEISERMQNEYVKDVVSDLLRLLKEWLENHLKTHDFKYRDYFIKNKFIK